MHKIKDFKFTFIYSDKPESEKLLDEVYFRVFQTAFENLMIKRNAEPIIKPIKYEQ